MEFVKLLSAGVFGALIIKIIDIIWLQRTIQNHERKKWKRDQKFTVYSKLSKDLISQEEWGKHKRSSEIYALLGESFLLIENKDLAIKLEAFYKESLFSLNKSAGIRQQAENYGDENLIDEAIKFNNYENLKFQEKAHEVLKLLREDMLK